MLWKMPTAFDMTKKCAIVATACVRCDRYSRSNKYSMLNRQMSTDATFPYNFSWVVDGLLAALGFPSRASDMRYLHQHGIRHLVSLTAEREPPSFKGINIIHIKMADFTPPSLPQVEEFLKVMKFVEAGRTAAAIHCAQGQGRTGTMIACYFVRNAGINSETAIDRIRQLRPGSVETEEQEDLVKQFERQNRRHILR